MRPATKGRSARRSRPPDTTAGAGSGALAATIVALVLFAVLLALALMSAPDSALSAWDRRVSDAFIAWRTPGRSELFWAVTLLGNTPVLAALSATTVLLLAAWGRRGRGLLIAVGLLIAWGISEATKVIVGRDRPPAADALIATPTSASLPSGHALTTLVFLGLLIYVTFRWSRPGTPGRRAIAWAAGVAALVVTGLIGVSRVYLGVHWMSDVFAAWAIGGAWLAVFVGVMVRYARKRRIAQFFSGPRPPARRAIRVATVILMIVLCVIAIVLTARADPLLADL